MGACPRCDGLGQITFFDPKRVVAFPHLSLAAGAIKGWDRRNQFYFQMLASLAQQYGFDVDTPFEHLPKNIQDLVLYGSGRDKMRFLYVGERGNKYQREHPFEGILPNLERRYRETDSIVGTRGTVPSISPTSPARSATARGCGAKRATSSWPANRSTTISAHAAQTGAAIFRERSA